MYLVTAQACGRRLAFFTYDLCFAAWRAAFLSAVPELAAGIGFG